MIVFFFYLIIDSTGYSGDDFMAIGFYLLNNNNWLVIDSVLHLQIWFRENR